MLGLSWRTADERDKKANGLPGKFLKGRQSALERYSKEAGDEDARLSAFYKLKVQVSPPPFSFRLNTALTSILGLKENGSLLAMIEGKADSSEFMKLSAEGWVLLAKTIETFESRLDGKSTFIVGDQIALAEFVLRSLSPHACPSR